MIIKESSWAHLTLVLVFHTIHQWAFVGGPHTIPYTSVRYGRVSSNSVTVEATKFTVPHKSCMCQYIINAWSTGPNRCGPWSTQVRATTFEAPNMKTDHSLTFPYGIIHFPLVAPIGLILYHNPNAKAVNHIGPPSVERAISRAIFQPLIFYR
jgi:hypothetical protein